MLSPSEADTPASLPSHLPVTTTLYICSSGCFHFQTIKKKKNGMWGYVELSLPSSEERGVSGKEKTKTKNGSHNWRIVACTHVSKASRGFIRCLKTRPTTEVHHHFFFHLRDARLGSSGPKNDFCGREQKKGSSTKHTQ